jgi:hypothetical protein
MNRPNGMIFGTALLAFLVGTSAQALADFQGFTTESPLFGERAVGNASIVVKTVTGTVEDNVHKIRLQDDLYHNELVETREESATEITFLDDTTISLGPESTIVLDQFVYDPDPNASSFVVTVTEGAMRFTSGVLPHDAYQIHTPVATIGIRGTVIDLVVDRQTESDGTVRTSVDLSVIEGEADMIGCDGKLMHVARGLSGRITGSSAACGDASGPPAQPAEVSANLETAGARLN